MGGEEWGVERGGALDMGSAPLETSSGSAPDGHLVILPIHGNSVRPKPATV